MDFKKHFEVAWNLILKYIAPLILMTIVMFIVSFFTLGILAPVTLAGYFQSILLMIREDREPKIPDIFSEMRLFFPLLVFGIVVFFATMIGFFLFVLPGIIISVGVGFICLYMLPLMTDKKLGIMEAIKESYNVTIKGKIADHIVVFILFIGISAVGSSVFIGWLFTQPLASILLLSVYNDEVSGSVAASPIVET
ncbi:hypothetical protein ACFL2O_00100 [Thermodesulfobacteriota bacterium]